MTNFIDFILNLIKLVLMLVGILGFGMFLGFVAAIIEGPITNENKESN